MSKKTAGRKMPTKKEILASKGLSDHAKAVLLGTAKPLHPQKVVEASPTVNTVKAPSARNASSSEDWEESYDAEGGRSPNDDRSDAMNPNNPAYQAAEDNRSNQMNPNNSAYGSSRGGGHKG